MNVLFVTTTPNRLYDSLMNLNFLSIETVDFSATHLDKADFLNILESHVCKKSYQLLITYRCPYIIPSSIRGRIDNCMNIHPVSLPEFSGSCPWEKLKMSGVKSSEVVAHLMEDIPDSGKIVERWPYAFETVDEAREVADILISEMFPQWIHSVYKNFLMTNTFCF